MSFQQTLIDIINMTRFFIRALN